MGIYDSKQWRSDREFKAEPGQEITRDIYKSMLEGMPPLDMPVAFKEAAARNYDIDIKTGFLMGEPHSADAFGHQLYMAFGRDNDKYYYLGLSPAYVYETYSQMKERHQREFEKLPIRYAFGRKQWKQLLSDWGITEDEAGERIYSLSDSGGFYLKEDADEIRDTLKRITQEEQKAIDADTTGDGYIYQMFLCELADHEYTYTLNVSDTLYSLGISTEDLKENKALYNGLQLAKQKLLKDDIAEQG